MLLRRDPLTSRGCGDFRGGLVPESAPSATSGSSAGPPVAPTPVEPLPRLYPRAGFGLSTQADPVLWAQRLGAGWYLDWRVEAQAPRKAPEHWQMVRITPSCLRPGREQIRAIAARYPGQVWILGNEPDVVWQDNLTPEAYAHAYHDLYYLIKAADPTAQIAVAGISQPTPLRLAYLQRVLEVYQAAYGEPMPVDWWTVHNFVLREEKDGWGVGIPPGYPVLQGMMYEVADHDRLDLFRQQIRDFRRWMAANGYRNRPLALTEFGVLMPPEYGFPSEGVADYLEATFAWLNEARDPEIGYPADDFRLVQRWSWFSLSDELYPASNLAALDDDRLTILGARFRAFTRRAMTEEEQSER